MLLFPIASFAADNSKYAVAKVVYKKNKKFSLSWRPISPDAYPMSLDKLNSLFGEISHYLKKDAFSLYGSKSKFSKNFGVLLRTYYKNEKRYYEWSLLNTKGKNISKMPLRTLLKNKTEYKITFNDTEVKKIRKKKIKYRSINRDFFYKKS